jgi:hypothetical protein
VFLDGLEVAQPDASRNAAALAGRKLAMKPHGSEVTVVTDEIATQLSPVFESDSVASSRVCDEVFHKPRDRKDRRRQEKSDQERSEPACQRTVEARGSSSLHRV